MYVRSNRNSRRRRRARNNWAAALQYARNRARQTRRSRYSRYNAARLRRKAAWRSWYFNPNNPRGYMARLRMLQAYRLAKAPKAYRDLEKDLGP